MKSLKRYSRALVYVTSTRDLQRVGHGHSCHARKCPFCLFFIVWQCLTATFDKMAGYDELARLAAIADIEIAEQNAVENNRRFRTRENAFRLSDRQFVRIFRLSKMLTNNLIEIVEPYIRPQSRISALDTTTKVLTALRFFATGSYQMDTASNIHLAVSQSSVSRCLHEVVDALNEPAIMNEWIKFPRNLNELDEIRTGFYRDFGFPGVIGCIDCTHVAIVPPGTNDPLNPEHIYVNRKSYHSINVQLICDSRLKIINVNARYPGSTNDAYIWNNSTVCNAVTQLHRQGYTNYYLLGDSGYPLRPWLLTPLENEPAANTPAAAFNECHRKTRCIIERCNGVLKMRFRCLLKHRVLHYAPTTASKIINACTVLHNMCIENNLPNVEEDLEDVDYGMYLAPQQAEVQDMVVGRVNPQLVEARIIQQRLIRNFFTQ